MGKTREKESSQTRSPLRTRTTKARTRALSISSFSSIEEAVQDVTKHLELLESPSQPKDTTTEPPTPRPTWKPRSRFSIIRARAYGSEEPVKFIPYHEMAAKAAEARQGPSTKIVSKSKNPMKERLSPKSNQQLFTPILKTYGRSKLSSKPKVPKITILAKEEKSDVQLAAFSKSEPSPIIIEDSSDKEKDSDWLLYKSPVVSVEKPSSKRGRRKPEPRKKLPLKRNVAQANAQNLSNIKRPRKLYVLKDVELSSSSSSSPISVNAAPRRFFRLRTKPPLRSATGRRAKTEARKNLADILNPSEGDENDEGFQE